MMLSYQSAADPRPITVLGNQHHGPGLQPAMSVVMLAVRWPRKTTDWLNAGDTAEEYWRGPLMKRAKRRSSRTTVHQNDRAQKCAVHNGPAEVSYDQPKAAEPQRG
jgi:hypothetical protein